jgi:hypothetical protein
MQVSGKWGSVEPLSQKPNAGSLQIRKGKDTFCMNTKDAFAFISMAFIRLKKKAPSSYRSKTPLPLCLRILQ